MNESRCERHMQKMRLMSTMFFNRFLFIQETREWASWPAIAYQPKRMQVDQIERHQTSSVEKGKKLVGMFYF